MMLHSFYVVHLQYYSFRGCDCFICIDRIGLIFESGGFT